MSGLINANKYDIEKGAVKRFSPHNESLRLFVTEDDCHFLETGVCPIYEHKNEIKCNCNKLLKWLETTNYTQQENQLPNVGFCSEKNYYEANNGQHRLCIASILDMDIMVEKDIFKSLGVDDAATVRVENGIPYRKAKDYRAWTSQYAR